MIAAGTLIAILVVMIIAMVRAFLGPTVHDRILAVNVLGTKTVLLIALAAHLSGTPAYLDIALVYALINFISIIGALQFFKQNTPRDISP